MDCFLKKELILLLFMCGYVQVSLSTHIGQKLVLDPLELELQAIDSTIWVLRTELGPLQKQHLV